MTSVQTESPRHSQEKETLGTRLLFSPAYQVCKICGETKNAKPRVARASEEDQKETALVSYCGSSLLASPSPISCFCVHSRGFPSKQETAWFPKRRVFAAEKSNGEAGFIQFIIMYLAKSNTSYLCTITLLRLIKSVFVLVKKHLKQYLHNHLSDAILKA